MPLRVLLVDPRADVRESLEIGFDPMKCELLIARDAATAFERLDRPGVDVLICEATAPGLDGFDLVPQLRRHDPGLEYVLLATRGDESREQEAARLGAAALIEHPTRPEAVSFAIAAATERVAGRQRERLLERELADSVGDKPIVGASESMIELLETMERAAGFKTPVLVVGEAGTHREVMARAIHAQSMRRAAPFVAIRCRAGSPDDVERRLFGQLHTARGHRGRCEASLADGGTLYIDDLVSLSTAAQERLLLLLEREEIVDPLTDKAQPLDVRIIVATTGDHTDAVSEGRLDPELLERLSHVLLEIPPLRARGEDVPLLADHVVARLHTQLGGDVTSVSATAMNQLRQYAWPGNLREFENVIERAMLISTTGEITLNDLPPAVATAVAEGPDQRGDFSLKRARRSFEAEMIRRALKKTDGNRTRAAKLLEISHRALLYKIKEFGLRD